jgi:hypothetical protein
MDLKIETILSLSPKKLRKLTPTKVTDLDGIELFKKLDITLEFMTFDKLAEEYLAQF